MKTLFPERKLLFLVKPYDMSFFSSFNLQNIQDSLPKVDLENISKSLQSVNPGKAVQEYSEQFKDTITPFTTKTQQLIATQLQQVQQLAASHTSANLEASELPADYLDLESSCDLLLHLYTDLIHYTNDTFATVSYDYPPGNSAITKIREANVGLMFATKFTQLKNVSTPQEMEKILLGKQENDVLIQVTSTQLPKTLFGQLSTIATRHGNEFAESSEPLSFALLQISSAYVEIASARLDQDKKIMAELNHALVAVLNEEFIKVNELRKHVYAARLEFDLVRAKESEDEDEELIAKEDELVSATEVAVLEMRKLLKPSKNIALLKAFVAAQKEFFELGAKKLAGLLSDLGKIEFKDDDDE